MMALDDEQDLQVMRARLTEEIQQIIAVHQNINILIPGNMYRYARRDYY